LDACEIFSSKTAHYVFTSSQSVYGPGGNLKEKDFSPENHPTNMQVTIEEYAEAKRQCEHIFSTHFKKNLTMVRFPIVLGTDDYTDRLKFHVENIREEKPIHFPNLEAHISFVNADDAAHALAFLGANPCGSINVCSAEPIKLKDLITLIEDHVGKKMKTDQTNHSPFGLENDWFMNTKKLQDLGFKARPLNDWLLDLIHTF
jgi:nucleoside-diphosphate-sugar epimerase